MRRLLSLLQRMPARSAPVALANVIAFGIQGLFALLLLGLFDPEQVAVYFVVSQIAFYWHNLALAQGNTTLITNPTTDIRRATRRITVQSILRLLLLLPLGYLGLHLSALDSPELQLGQLMVWTLLIALCQMAWYLAQAYLLRNGTASQSAVARVLPPTMASLVVCLGAALQWRGPVLLAAALLGFACGGIWLRDAWRKNAPSQQQAARPPTQRDDRSTLLRSVSTLMDGLFYTGLAIAWQRYYGGEHAGWLLTLMRLLGFIPSLVHTAWQQVVLATPDQKQIRSLWVALGSASLVMLTGLAMAALAQTGWLPQRWQGLQGYAVPAALWQAGACLTMTFSYLGFARGRAVIFGWLSIGMHSLCLIALLLPLALQLPLQATQHFWWVSIVFSSLSLLTSIALLKVPARPMPL